jgi:cytochrome c oxidase assembly factor CtaG
MHMVQHVLLGAVAPWLLWLGVPVLPFWIKLPRAFAPFGRFVAHPLTAWLAATVTVIGWHVPAAFALAQRSAVWHELQDASFLLAGLLFWWHVVQPWPAGERLPRQLVPLYLFTATLPCDALSAFLVFCDRVVYHQHLTGAHHVSISAALADQQTAGAFMWVSVTFIYLVPALVMTIRTLSPAQQLPAIGIAFRSNSS